MKQNVEIYCLRKVILDFYTRHSLHILNITSVPFGDAFEQK